MTGKSGSVVVMSVNVLFSGAPKLNYELGTIAHSIRSVHVVCYTVVRTLDQQYS
jgi:hypothetical protein